MNQPKPPCSHCQGAGCTLQISVLDPEEVDWDICPACDGDKVQK